MSILGHRDFSRLKMAACVSLFATLWGCGGTGQDKAESSTTPQVIQGLAIDGYLARSTVFIDYDNNRTRDAWEPFAFTDDDGYFSYNPATQTDYCAADASATQRLFCLRVNRHLAEAVIRIDGGYDVMTGEPFFGQLSRRVTQGHQGSIIISPLSSLLTDVRNEQQKIAILNALNISEDDLDQDYFNAENGNISAHLLSLALRLHKSVSIISQSIHDQYDDLGSQVGAMNDISANVYYHLAQHLSNGAPNLDDVLESPVRIAQVLNQIELAVLDYYDYWEMSLPYYNPAVDPAELTERVSGISQLISSLINENNDSLDLATARGVAKLIEAMTLKASGNNLDRATFGSSINYLLDSNNQYLRNALIDALMEDEADLTSLARLDFANSGWDSEEAVRNTTRLPDGASAFSDLAGRQMRVSDMDLGSAPNNLRDSEVELYFHADDNDTSGTFDACVKYIKDASISGKLGDANTRGELVSGHWSLLGASQNNGASYSLLLTFEFLGSKYQAILKPAAAATFDDQEYTGIRFDYANELRTWYSARGLETIRSLPKSAADCVARLPSRVGI
jgi:hypothetical protein